jgi:hypothetical protein
MFALEPQAGVNALVMEYISICLNPLQGLIKSEMRKGGMKWGRLVGLLTETGEHSEVLRAFLGELALMKWRIYEVQRVAMPTKDDPAKGTWNRSVRAIAEGTRSEMRADLRELAAAENADMEIDPDGIHRVYLSRRGKTFPVYERMYVAAPAGVQDKEEKKFRTAMAQYLKYEASLEAGRSEEVA